MRGVDTSARPQSAAAADVAGAGRPVVYVLDDDVAVQQGLRSLLRTYGMDVVAFNRAEDFLGAASGGGRACVLCEVDLPGMNGIELLHALNDRRLDIPVIMMSRRGRVADAVGAMRAGAVDFVEKPFLQEGVLARIIETLHWHAGGMTATSWLEGPRPED